MADTAQNISEARKRAQSKFIGSGHYGKGYLGVTRDGVKILRPKFPPKNFTEQELREAVAKALGKSA